MTTTQNQTPTDFTTIPATIVRRAQRAARVIRNKPNSEDAIKAEGYIEGVIVTLEAIADADEVDALMDILDGITCMPCS